jgi:hypothetical protein
MGFTILNWLCTLGIIRVNRMKEHGTKQINALMNDLSIVATVFLVATTTVILSTIGL